MVQNSREQKQERESQKVIFFFLKGCQAMSSERKEGT